MADGLWLRHISGSALFSVWYSSLVDRATRINPYSVVVGAARRSEFQRKLACPPEGFRRITRRERHSSGYVREASASCGGKDRRDHRGLVRCFRYDQPIVRPQSQIPTDQSSTGGLEQLRDRLRTILRFRRHPFDGCGGVTTLRDVDRHDDLLCLREWSILLRL